MATKTLGTNLTTSLTAVQFSPGSGLSDADIATIANGILNDQNPATPVWAGAFARSGLLYVPNRGVLKALPGDWVAIDATSGWPVLISGVALPATLAINGSPVNASRSMVMESSVLDAGWKVGMPIAGTNIPAGTKISNISADGLTVTMSAAATGTPGAVAVTASNFTHS